MRPISPFLAGLLLFATCGAAAALDDINPSKNTQPPSFWEPGGMGSRFSIFNGDPKRIQRANEVDPKVFDAKLDLTPNPLSIKGVKAAAPTPGFKLTFSVRNHGKKTVTLSFPTAQRWDFRVIDSTGKAIYVYSDNCEFEQTVGSSMVNPDDRLSYTETVDFDDLSEPLQPGTYTVQAVMANYPEIHMEAHLTVQP